MVTGREDEEVVRVVVMIVERSLLLPVDVDPAVDDTLVDVLAGGLLPPLHPMREDPITTSSYQKVFVSPP